MATDCVIDNMADISYRKDILYLKSACYYPARSG